MLAGVGRTWIRIMSRRLHLNASPPIHRGMMQLDRDAFHKTIPVLAARVLPANTNTILKAQAMKRAVVDLPKVRTVISDPSNPEGDRLVLLNASKETDLSPEALEFITRETNGLVGHTLELTYDYWTADEILHAILPEDLLDGSPSGFAMTGHLAHLNLNNEYIPYKHIIGQVILDKNKHVKTVVNKLDSINTQFRFFEMELLAGEPNYVVEHNESGCRFTFDFTKVYWNSRLHTEHDRIISKFAPEDVIVDVFAGVGPFAIPAARKGCGVLANDLNPESTKYLIKNVEDNRVMDFVRVYCEDGRDFIRSAMARVYDQPFSPFTGPPVSRTQQDKERRKARKLAAENAVLDAASASNPPRQQISHFVMNLPDSAIQFLGAFRGVLSDPTRNLNEVYKTMPIVHCHCFTRELEFEDADRDIRNRVEEQLEATIKEYDLYPVRSVGPNKEMYCISFRIPHEVAFS